MATDAPRRTWRETLAAYAHPRVRAMLFLGFSTGLAFPLVLMTLYARLRQAGIDRTTIGMFSLVGLMYSVKFFWSPLVDRLRLPLLGALGRRRSWMLLAQAGVAAGLVAMAFYDPALGPAHMALLAVLTAFAGATQDIVIDAYRIEAVGKDLQGSMVASWQLGYQLALICAQAGALTIAASFGWTAAYLAMATLLGVGMVAALAIDEPEVRVDGGTREQEARVVQFLERAAHWPARFRDAGAWLIGAIVCPVTDFFARYGLRTALLIAALIVTYRLNYMTMGVAANTFYLDLGFSLTQIALVSKTYGLVMTMAGGLLGGLLVARFGIPRTLLVGFVLLTLGNLFYAYIAGIHPGLWWLSAAVSVDNVGNGIAGVAFIAYMSSLTNPAYTATQFALFGMLWSLPAKSLASQWGRIVDAFGYRPFFVYTALIGLPSLLLVLWLMRQLPARPPASASPAKT